MANIMDISSIASTTTAAVTAGGGDMIVNNNNNYNNNSNNTRHLVGGSRMVSGSSPWNLVVRGGDSSDAIATSGGITAEAAAASPSPSSEAAAGEVSAAVCEEPTMVVGSSSVEEVAAEEKGCENGNGTNGGGGNAGKKPAWNKPSNGAAEIGAIMGADSWPALSESARVSGKLSQQDLSSSNTKGPALSDGSSSSLISVPQGSGSASQSFIQKQVSHNANPNSTLNHSVPGRQRSMKRNGGANPSPSNGGPSQPPGLQRPQTGEMHLNNPSPRDQTSQRNSQNRSGNDNPQQQQQQQQQQRNSYRRNGGLHGRDNSHHHGYTGRRDQDRPNHDWNNHRNFSGRDAHMQSQRVVPRYMRHPPNPPPPPTTSPTFIGHQTMRAYSPIAYHAPVFFVPGLPPDPIRGVPYVVQPVCFPAPDPQLHSKIANQIEYYFSNENLIKDTFLRQNMDDQGWVPIKLIAGFKKVSDLTDNIQLILDAIRNSIIVETQVDKVRKRNDWMRWVMPPSLQFPSVSGSPTLGRSGQDMLAAQVQSISLEDSVGRSPAGVYDEALLGMSSSGDLNSPLQVLASEGTGQFSTQGGSNFSNSTRNLNK